MFETDNDEEGVININIIEFALGTDLLSEDGGDIIGEYLPTWTVYFNYGYKNLKYILTQKSYWIIVLIIIIISFLTLYLNIGNFIKYKKGFTNLFIYANAYSIKMFALFGIVFPILFYINHIDKNPK